MNIIQKIKSFFITKKVIEPQKEIILSGFVAKFIELGIGTFLDDETNTKYVGLRFLPSYNDRDIYIFLSKQELDLLHIAIDILKYKEKESGVSENP